MGNKIGPAPAPADQNELLSTSLPSDEQALELALVNAMVAIFNSIPHLSEYVKVEARERFPDNDEDDADLSTVADQIVLAKKRTSLLQIGIPTVEEFERSSDLDTTLIFTYPMTYDLEVVDNWDSVTSYYKNSRQLAMAVYMTSRRAFKNKRTLGFRNCVTEYLQQVNATTVEVDDETGGLIHAIDWSLTVKVTGVLV